MSNYISNFINRFQVGNFGLSGKGATSESETGGLVFNFITVYNPLWTSDKDESLEAASKQILFFLSARDPPQQLNPANDDYSSNSSKNKIGIQEQVHLIGLLRGSHALVSDFSTNISPIAITLSNETIVIVEIETGFYLACCMSSLSGSSDGDLVGVTQTEALIKLCHRRFQLFNSSFDLLINLHGKDQFSKILRSHWKSFLNAVNNSSLLPFGPFSLKWPTRINPVGALLFLGQKGYRKSSLRFPEHLKAEMEDLIQSVSPQVSGWTVFNVDKALAKDNGFVYMSPQVGSNLSQEYINAIYDYLYFLYFNDCLDPQHVADKSYLALYFQQKVYEYNELAQSSQTQDRTDSDSEPDDDDIQSLSAFGVSPAAALELLHPVTLTNNLVVQPLNTTVSQFKHLGLAVTDTIVSAPDWLNRWRAPESPLAPIATRQSVESQASEAEQVKGRFLSGLVENSIQNFIVYLPTNSENDQVEWREYLIVVYKCDCQVVTLMYESGLDVLANASYYDSLEKDLLIPILVLMKNSYKNNDIDLSASIGSLPGPIGEALSGEKKKNAKIKMAEEQIKTTEIDSQFFYIIYDIAKGWYQTSLPELSTHSELKGIERSVFHLHNQIGRQFFTRGRQNTFFTSSASDEHLHKFASSKNNDWLFYSLKYKGKVIVVIRNYNHRIKPKVPPEPANSYLTQVADSVYGAANLGFLDSLGSDVKGWLGRLGSQEED